MRGWPISNGRRILFGSASAPTDTPHRSFPALISRKRSTAPRPAGRSGLMPDPLPAEAPVARVTLSRAAILSARALLLAFSGAEKRAVVERALRAGSLARTPIGRVLAKAEGPIDIHWSAT